MELTTERLEDDAALLLLLEDIPIQPEASENLLRALTLGLLVLDSAQAEREHLDQSIKAGRQFMAFAGAVA